MKEILKKIGSRILGTLAGAITGIGAGFLPGYYYFINEDKGSNYVGGLAYLLTLPFLVGWQMCLGAIEGAKQGLMSGLVYPQTLYEKFQIPIRNKEVLTALDLLEKNNVPVLLSSAEQVALEALLNDKQITEQKREKLASRYTYYLNYINSNKSPLTDVPLKEIEHPIIVRVNDQTYICEREKLKTLVEESIKKGEPATLNNTVINASDIFSLRSSIPETLTKFIAKVRSFFNSLYLINKTLGFKQDASIDLSLLPPKKVTPIALLTYPTPEVITTPRESSTETPNTQNESLDKEPIQTSTPSVGMRP